MPYADRNKRLEQSRNWYYAHKQTANNGRKNYKQSRTIRETGLAPKFIAIDGEGIDIDNRHCYTYLAASNNHSISDWSNGLSTHDCFVFLLNLKRTGHVVVGFSLGYDDNMVFRDITPDYLLCLWNTNECILPLDGQYYKLTYVPAKFLNIAELKDVHVVDGKVKYKIARSVRVWDVFGFFQGSFISVLEDGGWIPEHEMGQGTLELIRHMKESRKDFKNMSHDEIEFYCREECRILQELMTRLADTLWSLDIKLRSWHGAGAISGYLMKQHGIRDTLDWTDLPDIVREASLWSYFGGRVELYQQGPIKAPLYDYDRTSAYPSTIIDLPYLRNGNWFDVIGSEVHLYNPFCKYGLWDVEWDIPENHPHAWLAPFPQRGKDNAIYWVTKGSGWYHTSEVQAASRIFGPYIKIKRGVYFVDEEDLKPFAWVYDLLTRRVEYKKLGDPRHIVLKLAYNSIYGKLAQGARKSGRRPPFQNYFLAGYITAATRAAMLSATSLLYHHSAVCVATDGLFCTEPIDLPLNGGIGGWELKEIDEPTFFAQAGVYYSPTKYDEKGDALRGTHVRTRGFHPRSMDYETLIQRWNTTPDYARPDIKIGYTENRFVGLGYAALTGHWDEYRNWIDRDRFLALRTEPRKIHEESSNESTGNFLLLPGIMDIGRAPYAAREKLATQVEKYPDTLLDLIVLLDQPDFLT